MWPLVCSLALLLTPITGHPCPVSFPGPGEKVSIKHSNMLAQLVSHVIGGYIGVVYRDFRIRKKLKSKKLPRCKKNPLNHLFKLEIRLEQLVVHFKFLL